MNWHWCYRADFRLVPIQWEMSLQNNDVSHWMGANLESALCYLVNQTGTNTNDLYESGSTFRQYSFFWLNIHTFFVLCFDLFNYFLGDSQQEISTIFFRVTSLALGQLYDSPSACEVALKWVSEWLNLTAFLGTADSKVYIVHISHVIIQLTGTKSQWTQPCTNLVCISWGILYNTSKESITHGPHFAVFWYM